jgi:putative peptidoglycan lipid II flippase
MNAMLLLTVVTGLLTAVFVLAAPFLVPLFAPGFKGELLTLTIVLSQIMFPILILIAITSVIAGVLNSFHRFAAVAVAPIFWNLAIIATILVLTPSLEGEDRIYAYAIGVLLGTIVQLAIPAWDLRNTPFDLSLPRLREAFKSPDVRRVVVLMLPVMLTIGLLNFNLLVNSLFGTLVSTEGPAAIDKAFRLYILPQGLTVVALTVVLYPTLSRYASRGEIGRLRDTLGNGMRQVIVLTVPAMAALLVLSEPIVRLIYQRGEFDSAQTVLVASALFWLSLSLPFNGLLTMQNRTFFSMQEPWLPALFAAVNLALTAGISAALYEPYGIAGIMFATTAASAISTLLQSVVLRKRLSGLEVMRLLSVSLRVLIASALLAGISWEIWNLLEGALGTGLGAQILSVGLALGVGGAVYIGAVLAMRVPEAHQLLRVARRIRD